MLSRRKFLAASVTLIALIKSNAWALDNNQVFYQAIADLEKAYGGRLGVAALDTQTGKIFSHRGRERFALCSTFKVLSAALILSRVDKGEEALNRVIKYQKNDLVEYSPVTEQYAGKGMTIAALSKAAITHSDNTAANLMFDSYGGPEKLTRFLRTLGDRVTRSDRYEPLLNNVPAGEFRDTTTPVAMVKALEKILLGDSLTLSSRKLLKQWLIENTTGDHRLRAGLPKNWLVGDKTGTGPLNETNDVAIVWPLGRKPIIVSVYYAQSNKTLEIRNKVIARVGSIVGAL